MLSPHTYFRGQSSRLMVGVAAALLSLAPAIAEAANFQVELNQSRALQLDAPAATVIVGNPAIADVSIQGSKLIYVLGRSYGSTNLIILDSDGKQVKEMDLSVIASSDQTVTLNRGAGQLTFNCSPRCERTVTPGDEKDGYMTALQQATSGSAMNTSAARASGRNSE